MMRRRGWVAVLAFVAALVLADTAVWQVAEVRLRAAYAQWQTSLAPSGWRVTSDPPVAAGWPLAAQLRLRHARLGQSGADGFAWSADEVRVGVSLLHPRVLAVTPEGDQSLTVPGWTPVRFHAGSLAATAPLGNPIEAAQAEATHLSLTTPVGEVVVEAARLEVAWARDAVHVQLTAGPIGLPPGRRWGLGQTVTRVAIELVGHEAWPPGGGQQAAERWRDAGGIIDIAQLAAQWGTLDVRGSGTLGLDAAAAPRGQLALTVIDPQAAIDTLANTGAIGPGAATAAGAVVGLLLLPQRLSGGPPVLNVPVRLDSGVVFLGQIPVARVRPLRWP